MSEFIAGAFVDVQAEFKTFRSDLKRGVNEAIKSSGTFKVPVEVDTKKVKSALDGLARGVKVKVTIEPGTTVAALRRDLKKIVDGASQNLKVKIPVEVQHTTARGAAPPTPAAVKVPIIPGTSVAELKRLFDERIRAATKDLKVKVPVEAEAVHSGKITGTPPASAPVKVPIVPGTSVADLKKAFKDRVDAATKDIKAIIPLEFSKTPPAGRQPAAPTVAAVKVPIVPGTSVADLKKAFKDRIDAATKNLKVVIPAEVSRVKAPTAPATATAAPTAAAVKVPIVPGTTVADLKKAFKDQIDAATKGLKAIIPVELAKPTGAKTAAAAKAATPAPAATPPAKVPVVAGTSIADLRKSIKDKITAAAKDLKIVIPVEAKAAGKLAVKAPAAAATPTTAPAPAPTLPKTTKAIEVPIKISTTVAQLKEAIRAKISSAQKDQKIVVPLEVKQTGKITPAAAPAARAPSTRATASGTAADAVDKSNQKAEKSTKKLTEAQKRQALVSSTVKKSENDLAIATRLFAQAQEQNIQPEERTQRLREARAASSKAAKSANDLLATSEKTLTNAQRSALENRVALATNLRADITAKQEAAAADKAASAVEKQSSDARKKGAEVIAFEAKEIQDLNALHLKENEVLAAEAAIRRETNAARKLGLTGVAQENEALLKQIALQKESIVLRRRELKGDSDRIRSQKTAGRGAASALLSLLGLRGATLASSAAFLAGAASAALFTKSVSEFASFEQELNVFQATTAATADQMARVAKVAHELGADITLPAVSAADAAQAMSQLARAGLSVEDSVAGARGVLELASAAMISNADAAELTASALNAFGLEGTDAVHVADLLANAANNAQGSISEMGAAMQQASAIAHQVGLSLDNTVAILTQFARHGLRGSDAGTSLRTALSRLIAPTHKAAQLIGDLGIKIRDANGNIKPDIFVQFGQATEDLTPAFRDAIAETIAGQDAIRAFAIGASEGARGLRLAQLQMQATGTAAAIAAARSKGLSGQFSALQSNTETLGTSLGKLASGPIKTVTSEVNDMFVALNQLATGDFSGFSKGVEKDFDQAAANIKRHFGGLKKIVTGTDFSSLGSGLKELVTPADNVDKETKRIQDLEDALQRLQQLRVDTFKVSGESAIGGITEQIKRIRAELKAAKVDAGLIIPVTPLEHALAPLRTALKEAQDLRQQILDSGGNAADTRFLDTIIHNFNVRIALTTRTFKANAKKMGKDLEDAVTAPRLAKSFEKEFAIIAQQPLLATPEVIASLVQLTTKIKGVAPLTGAAGKEIGQKLLDSINEIIRQAVKDDNPELAQDMKALAEKIAALFGGELPKAFKNIKIPLTDQQLADALLPSQIKTARAEAFGTVADQIAGKQGELDALNKQLQGVVKGSQQEADILGKISATKEAIRSLREQQASDQKEKDTKSDKKVTDALSGRERTLTQALEKAQNTETLKDDLRRERDLRDFYAAEIKTIKATVKDADTRREQVQQAEDNLFKINQQIEQDRAGRREQLQQQGLKPIDDAAERASETETLKDDVRIANRKVRFWQTQVRNLKRLVKERKATADELKKARDALDEAERDARDAARNRKQQVLDDKEQSLQLDIEFAQTTENKGKELRARTAFISFLQQQIKGAKGNVLKIKELRNQIAEQRKAIKDLKGETDKGDKGTTVFELLQQNAENFKANAGNLISGNQPFAGPAGFTADVAQFLIRQKKAADDLEKASKSSAAAISSMKGPKIAANKVVSRGGGVLKDATVTTTVPAPKIPPEKVVSRGGGPLLPIAETKTKTDTVKSTDFQNLTGAVIKLTNVLERQPGVGKTSTTSAKRQPASTGRAHNAIATASRRVVEERTSI